MRVALVGIASETMTDEKRSLDALRIDRGSEEDEVRRIWPTLLIAVAVVATGLGLWLWLGREQVAQVSSATAREADSASVGTVLNASGYVTARRQATVSSKVTGKVVEVFIEEGMAVEEGQVLARLDDTNVRASYDLAVAQQSAAEASLDETRALLDEARVTLQRNQDLVDGGVSSQAALDRARAEADSLAARLRRQEREVVVAERQVGLWRRQLEDTIIRAPFAGVVVSKDSQPGEMISPVSAGGGFTRTGIGTVVDMSSLEIEVDVNEAYINRVTSDQEVVATLDAYPEWRIPCHVIAIIPTADRQRATVEVRVGFDELDPRVLPDMGVKVAFQEALGESTRAGGVLVPSAAVRKEGATDIVLVIQDDVVERRAVSVAETRGAEARVVAGLAGGERVVVEGPTDLADGDRVKEATN